MKRISYTYFPGVPGTELEVSEPQGVPAGGIVLPAEKRRLSAEGHDISTFGTVALRHPPAANDPLPDLTWRLNNPTASYFWANSRSVEIAGALAARHVVEIAREAKSPVLDGSFWTRLEADLPDPVARRLMEEPHPALFSPLRTEDAHAIAHGLMQRRYGTTMVAFAAVHGPQLRGAFPKDSEIPTMLQEANVPNKVIHSLSSWIIEMNAEPPQDLGWQPLIAKWCNPDRPIGFFSGKQVVGADAGTPAGPINLSWARKAVTTSATLSTDTESIRAVATTISRPRAPRPKDSTERML